MNWQREVPTEEGDWLWLCIWSCGCCVRSSGVAFVDEEGVFHFNGNSEEDVSSVTAWAKIELPPQRWSEDWHDEN